jgi:hypothetical protein
MTLKEIIEQTVDDIIMELNKCPLNTKSGDISVKEELPQDEEDFIGTSNVSTATWRENKHE